MTASLVRLTLLDIPVSSDVTVYEASQESTLLVKNLQTLMPYVIKMIIETMNTTGELRVPFKHGRVVDDGPGKKRPKIMLD